MQSQHFLDAITTWVAARTDVVGLALAGSYAHGTARPDSDIDLVLLCKEPTVLAQEHDWVCQFGTVREIISEQYGIMQALRVFYRDGLEVELGLGPLMWADIPIDAGTQRVISDGIRILYDPSGLLHKAKMAAIRL